MILTCPACATSYFVPDEAIGPNGRRVRCKSCGHDWRASLEDTPLELEPAGPEADAAVAFGKRDETPDSLAETPAPELPRAFRARVEQKRRLRQAATQGAAWAALAVVVLGLLGAAFLWRGAIVKRLPQTAAVYKALGAPVNIVGLDFEAQGARSAPHDPARIVVYGALRNVSDREVVAPPLRIVLTDAAGAEVARTVLRLQAPPVLPGKVQGFAAVLPDPERKAAGMKVDFALAPEPAREPARAAPAAGHGAAHGAGEAAESLRRISAYEPSPIDARPLDSKAAEGLSAMHG